MKPLNELIEEMREAAGKATIGIIDVFARDIDPNGKGEIIINIEPELGYIIDRYSGKHIRCPESDQAELDCAFYTLANPQNVTRILDHCDDLKRKYEEAMEVVGFYSKGGNSNRDIWEHPDLGFFTGKRARDLLKRHGVKDD